MGEKASRRGKGEGGGKWIGGEGATSPKVVICAGSGLVAVAVSADAYFVGEGEFGNPSSAVKEKNRLFL
jgi:hypothetical protein